MLATRAFWICPRVFFGPAPGPCHGLADKSHGPAHSTSSAAAQRQLGDAGAAWLPSVDTRVHRGFADNDDVSAVCVRRKSRQIIRWLAARLRDPVGKVLPKCCWVGPHTCEVHTSSVSGRQCLEHLPKLVQAEISPSS